jgi:aldose sugar dehydrogenase
MKSFSLILAALCLSLFSIAQPTWQIGNTQVTEYDLVTGVQIPWELLWGPDAFLWCTERAGKILRIDPATGNFTVALDHTNIVASGGEPGMLGMAMHPDWENTPQVFVVYNTGSGWNIQEQLSVFYWNGTTLENEQVLIADIPGGGIHNGSRLLITPDNKLMMTTGDTGDGGESSQDITALNGKTLRINLDGSIPSDNPDPTSYVWSWGHRNSQGLCNGPNGIIYASEHGQSDHDEFNIIEMGRNYGWPDVEGICNTVNEASFCNEFNVKEPLKEWSPCIAVNGIEYYNHPSIPEWQNSVLMAVLGGLGSNYERLSVLHMSEDGLTVESEDQFFSEFNQRIRDIAVNPNTGAVYVALNGPNYPGSGPNIIKEFVNDGNDISSPKGQNLQDIQLFPNPVDTELTMEFTDSFLGTSYQVFGFNGMEVHKAFVDNNTLKIDVSSWSAGSYYLTSTTHLGTVTRTFVVK